MATKDTEPELAEGPRSFVEFLRNVGYGDALREASEELFTLNNKMQDEALARGGKAKVKGELNIKFKFTQDARGIANVTYDIVRKDPKRATGETVLFVTKSGNLQVDNPRQEKLPLREVEGGRGAARTINDDVEVRGV